MPITTPSFDPSNLTDDVPPPHPHKPTTNGLACILDPYAYPTIVDMIVDRSTKDTHLALWATNKAFHNHLSARFYRKIIFVTDGSGWGTDDLRSFPEIGRSLKLGDEVPAAISHNIEAYTRTAGAPMMRNS